MEYSDFTLVLQRTKELLNGRYLAHTEHNENRIDGEKRVVASYGRWGKIVQCSSISSQRPKAEIVTQQNIYRRVASTRESYIYVTVSLHK